MPTAPVTVLVVLLALLGAAAGPLVAHVCWRLSVPSGEPHRSHCQDCGADCGAPPSRPPRLRCPGCGRRLGPAVPWVSLLTALGCAAVGWRIGPHPALAAYVLAVPAGVVLAVVDAGWKRLPDVVVLPLYPAVAALLGLAQLTDPQHGSLVRALAAMTALAGVFFLLVLASPASLGLGDVKLIGVLGLLLGWQGWREVLTGTFLGFLLAACAAVFLLVGRRAGRRDTLPFGPFLLLGALVALLL